MIRGLFAALALALSTAAYAAPVTTDHGPVAGVAADGVESFKGIPFAAPPVGDLRWRAPQPPAAWTAVRSADAFAPACPQHLPASWGYPDPKWSEDCLYLNVWRPATAVKGAKLPVMVWIYGGGFTIGYGGSKIYDGAKLAQNGVIVVNMNYRLGRLGWFAHPALTLEAKGGPTGDFGLMDQIAALKCVQANIAEFGGDPANVTIFGESAGGMSVNLLMVAPSAKGLFAKAITESGLGRIPAKSLATAEAQGDAFAKQIGALDPKALRALPVEALLGGIGSVDSADNPGPIVDGVLVPENVDKAFAAGHEAKVPWIVGTNNYEASLFPSRLADPEGQVFSLVPAPTRPFVLKAFDDGSGDKTRIAANILTDKVFTEPARYLAALHEKNGAPVWRYYFGYLAEGDRAKAPGAGHGGEIQFVFGNLGTFRGSTQTYTDADRGTAAALGAYWTRFAKAGDPNGPGQTPWPEDKADTVLVIDTQGRHAEAGLLKIRLGMMALSNSTQ